MDVETRALLIGLSRTLARLTVNLVEEGAIDSVRAVRDFEDFAKSLGNEPHDQATRLWVDHIVETLKATSPAAVHLPNVSNTPKLSVEETGSGDGRYVPVGPARAPVTVTYSSEPPSMSRFLRTEPILRRLRSFPAGHLFLSDLEPLADMQDGHVENTTPDSRSR